MWTFDLQQLDHLATRDVCQRHVHTSIAAGQPMIWRSLARERWAEGDVELVRKTAERVVGCARELIATLGLDVELVTEEEDLP